MAVREFKIRQGPPTLNSVMYFSKWKDARTSTERYELMQLILVEWLDPRPTLEEVGMLDMVAVSHFIKEVTKHLQEKSNEYLMMVTGIEPDKKS